MSEIQMGRWSGKTRIWVQLPFNRALSTAMKNGVPGFRWSKDLRIWHFPLDFETARDVHIIAKKYGYQVVIEPDLAAWFKNEKNRFDTLIKPDDLDADVSHLLPRLRAEYPHIIAAMEQKPWQIPATAFMVAQRNVLLADKPGLGKTLETIAAIVEKDIKGLILVVAPRSAVRITWPDEIYQWLGPDEFVFIINAECTPEEREDRMTIAKSLEGQGVRVWVLLGPNYLRIRADVDAKGNFARDEKKKKIIRPVNEAVADIFSVTWDAVIVDESHQSLAGGSGGVGKRKWSAQRLGLDALTLKPGAMRIAISGTPFRGKTENLWGTLNWLDRRKYPSYWNWIKRHYGVVDEKLTFGKPGSANYKEVDKTVKGDEVLDENRFYAELKPYMCRRTKEEIQVKLPPDKRLPPKEYQGTYLVPGDDTSPKAVWLPLTPQQRKQYDKVVSDAMIYIDDLAVTNVNGALAEMTRFKQLADSCLGAGVKQCMPSNKAEWIVDFLKDRQESDGKVIIASHFTQFLNMLSLELESQKIAHYVYTGETNDPDRDRIKSAFQGDGDAVLLLNTLAGGASLTLDKADDVVICDQTWIPDEQEQVEDRAHRSAGRIHQVNVWYLASLNTIDEDVAIVNNERARAIKSIIDEERYEEIVMREVLRRTKQRQGIAA